MSSLARPAHLQPGLIGLVAVGGAAGAVTRSAVSTSWVHHGHFAWPILIINCLGALILGALLEALTRLGPDTGLRRTTRLLVGTGFCGAFTTYSTFSHDVVTLNRHHPVEAAVWGLSEVALGLVCAGVGAAIGAWSTRHRQGGDQ